MSAALINVSRGLPAPSRTPAAASRPSGFWETRAQQPLACAGLRDRAAAAPLRRAWPATTLQLLQRRPRRRAPPPAAPPRAALYSLPSDLYASLQTGCGVAYLLALGFSALPILTGDSKERNQRRFLQPDDDEGTENIRWSVMGVLSVLPFINPMAWVFAALDDDDSSALYWTLAFIYALPYLGNGFQLDGFALVSLLFCITHVQVERIAQTEPAEVELPTVLRSLLSSIPKAVRSLGRYSSELGEEVGRRTSSSEDAVRRRPDRKYLEERSREARAELEDFDRRRRERAAEAQRLWRDQGDQEEQEGRQQRRREKEKER